MRAIQHQDKHRKAAVLTPGGGPPEPPARRTPRHFAARPAVVLTGIVAAAVLATACSSSPPAPSVASLPGHHASGGTAAQLTQAQSDQDMVAFAHCMRAHGVDIPDPFHRPGHAGLSIEIPGAGPTAAPGVRPALAACNHFIQPLIQMKQAGQEALAAPRLPALTNYARCMRAHNIPLLDPTTMGQLNLGHVPGISSNFGRYSPQFRAADTACRHLLPAGVADNGTGP